MSFRWNEDTTYKFVSQYLKYESLWNLKSPLYKNKQARQSAYNHLENIMNISAFGEKEIKLKIKNIRSTYSQELKKISDSIKSGADTVYVPSVKWFKILDDSLRIIHSNLPSTDNEANISAADIEFREHKITKPTNKKQRLSQLNTVIRELKEIAETVYAAREDNEFEIFGKHVGLQLKAMPLLLALEAQEHIQLYLNKIRRQHLENSSEQREITHAIINV